MFADIAWQLYGATTDYVDRLQEFCSSHWWQLHPNQNRQCLTLLERPNHRCTSQDCYSRSARGGLGHDLYGYNLDHTVLLRRGPAKRPTQWAILSQPYSDDDPGGTAHRLGPAPYGHGTHALLYVGEERAS